MNLPVHKHINRLFQAAEEMRDQIDHGFQQIQVLRALIGKLSFVNKEADKELNQFLTKNINEVKKKVASDWKKQEDELLMERQRIKKITQEQEDLEIHKKQLQSIIDNMEEVIGL